MSTAPVARLQSLSEEEKLKLSGILKRKLLVRAFIFIAAILAGIAVVVFFNKFSSSYNVEDNLEIINVVFVVVIVVCARFLFSEFADYRKEEASPSKRVVHTRIVGRQGDKIVLGNRSFGSEDILLDNSEFDSLKGGDNVVLELSAKSNLIFSVKKSSK